jgi:hypothetical protein
MIAAFTSKTTSTRAPAKEADYRWAGAGRAGRRPAASAVAVRQAVSETTNRACVACLQAGSRLQPTIAAMKILNLLHVVVAQAFYKWAMREINPMHPDVPRIMLRQQELSEKYRRIWA